MVVKHNITAMNSNRMLGLTTSSQAKSTEKLSSGYKINRAADDAAGLAISEKMRKQVRGLTQASANAQDGISAVQTAEGALTEVHDMLQRMNELAVKASNGTNSESDRQAIQDEIDQLVTEIDRVSTTTKFNETYLLQGDAIGKAEAALSDTTTITGVTVEASKGASLKAGTLKLGDVIAKVNATVTNCTASLSGELSGDALEKINATDNTTGQIKFFYDKDNDIWKMGDGDADNADDASGSYKTSDLKQMGINVAVTDKTKTASFTVEKAFDMVDAKETQKGVTVKLTTAGTDVTAENLASKKLGSAINITVKATDSTANPGENAATFAAYDPTYAPDALEFKLHVGADSDYDNKIGVEIAAMSAAGLGLLDSDGELKVDGKDSTNADNAIDTIAAAIKTVSTQRSALGAVQNRLEHTINNLDNVVENTTSAEAQIRDTDIATEMVKYSNNNILQQAGTSMLSQANQSNQLALSLLG